MPKSTSDVKAKEKPFVIPSPFSFYLLNITLEIIMKITASENDINDISQTFRLRLISSSVHYKLKCSDHGASSYWSLTRKAL